MSGPAATVAPLEGPRRSLARRLCGWPAAVALLAIHAVLGFGATLDKTVTFDEGGYLAAGLASWTLGRYDVDPVGGVLTQRWSAMPLALDGVRLSRAFADAPTQPNQFEAAHDVVFGAPGRAERVLPMARAAMTLLSVALGAVVYLWSRRLFGRAGALVSLTLFAFCPNFLAHGPLATSDVAATLFFLCGTGALWLLVHRVSPFTLLLAGIAVGGLCLSKMSAALVVPIAAALLTVRLAAARPLVVALPARRIVVRGRSAIAAALAAAAPVVVALASTCVWAGYGFRFGARPAPGARGPSLVGWDAVLVPPTSWAEAIEWARDLHLLPEAWLYGLAYAIRSSAVRLAFLNGEVRETGWPWFFPYALLVKTPLATLGALAAAAAAGVAGLRRGETGAERRRRRRRLYRTTPLWALLAVYSATAISSNLNLGVRHVLPVAAASYVLAGALGRWLVERGSALRWAAAVAFVMAAVESVAAYPDYLAFFNVLAGGPRHGYEHLVDSSLDWGQDLPALKRWLDEHGLQRQDRVPVYLSYFGNGDVRYYGIEATVLLGFGFPPQQPPTSLPPLRPGVYCISATLLQGVYWFEATGTDWRPDQEVAYQEASAASRLLASGTQLPPTLVSQLSSLRMARLSRYLRTKEPVARIHHTIFVYVLDDEDIAVLDQIWTSGAPPSVPKSSRATPADRR